MTGKLDEKSQSVATASQSQGELAHAAQAPAAARSQDAVPSISKEKPRRNLFSNGLAAAVAVVATACGASSFGGKGSKASNKDNKDGSENKIGDLGDSGAGPKDGSGDPTPGPTPTVVGTVVANNPEDPCSLVGPGVVTIVPITSPALDIKFKAYGTKDNAMVVVKFATGLLQVNDFVTLVEVNASGTAGKVVARRRINGVDTGTGIIIFDALSFVGVVKLGFIVNSGATIKRSPDWDLAFQVKVKHPGNASDTTSYDVVDVVSQRYSSANNGGYAITGRHPNYYDGSGLVLSMNWGSASSYDSGGKQNNKGQEDRVLKQANMSATWPVPGSLPASYHFCDAFGDKLPMEANVILKTHSVIIAYVQDGTHFHRYFFHVG